MRAFDGNPAPFEAGGLLDEQQHEQDQTSNLLVAETHLDRHRNHGIALISLTGQPTG